MVTNEVFLDSATLRENVVSLSTKHWIRSKVKKVSSCNISFSVDASGSSATSITLKNGVVCLSSKQFGNKSYTFSIVNDITRPIDSNGLAIFENIDIYEGTFLKQDFTVSSTDPNQRYILPNGGIDTSLLRVIVKESESSSVSLQYTLFDSVYGVTPTTPVFYIQETDSERYELFFGDGVFGKAVGFPTSLKCLTSLLVVQKVTESLNLPSLDS